MLTDADLRQLQRHGIPPDEAASQLRLLRGPARYVRLDRPCTVGDGILRLDPSAHERWLTLAREAARAGRVQKFVPASGAATRMFKDLIAALATKARPSSNPAAREFFAHLDELPFAGEARRRSGVGGPIATVVDERAILRTLLHDMRYAALPKALIPFHRAAGLRTPFEEHLLEALRYVRAADGRVRTHFTVAPEFRADFARHLAEIAPRVAAMAADPVELAVTFSEQHPSTDTLAITPEGEPFRTSGGELLIRPSGHGALLRNLQALNGDLVVIKNIDNVLPFERSDEVVYWKQLVIGCLVERQAAADGDRPLRVCGVVANEGDPGGAPFWVRGDDGRVSPQIVESASVDLDDPEQRRIFASSTHFNPVDVVCALRTKDGRPYDLQAFVDPTTVFVARKSHEGRDVIALERPGLWNGSMAGWNTAFVEVPPSTFAPVKTVLDLLRPEHQSL